MESVRIFLCVVTFGEKKSGVSILGAKQGEGGGTSLCVFGAYFVFNI